MTETRPEVSSARVRTIRNSALPYAVDMEPFWQPVDSAEDWTLSAMIHDCHVGGQLQPKTHNEGRKGPP